jgi:hypothetical protein
MLLTTLYILNSFIAQGVLSLSAIDDQKKAVEQALVEIVETQRSVNKQLEAALKDADSERI